MSKSILQPTTLPKPHVDPAKQNPNTPSFVQKCCKATFWVILMLAMIGLFTILYDVNYTRPFIHEIVGTVLIVVLGFHIWKNRSFFSFVGRKNFPQSVPLQKVIPRYANPYFMLSDAVNILLFISCIVCLITGILISKFVFKDMVAALFAIENTRVFRPYHAMSCYILLIAIGLHAGLQLPTLFNFITNAVGKIWQRITLICMSIMAINGLYCVFAYNFISKFQLKPSKSIGTLHPELYRVFYWTDLICIAVLFALISYVLATFFNHKYANRLTKD